MIIYTQFHQGQHIYFFHMYQHTHNNTAMPIIVTTMEYKFMFNYKV